MARQNKVSRLGILGVGGYAVSLNTAGGSWQTMSYCRGSSRPGAIIFNVSCLWRAKADEQGETPTTDLTVAVRPQAGTVAALVAVGNLYRSIECGIVWHA